MRKKVLFIFGTLITIIFMDSRQISYAQEITEMQNTESETEMGIEPETEIYFDAEAVKNRKKTKSAVSDIHGVFVFRNEFIEREELVKKEEENKRQQIFKTVFGKEKPEDICKLWVDIVLNSKTDKFIRDIDYKEKNSELLIWITCIAVCIGILCLALLMEDYKKGQNKYKKRQDDENENYYNI